jgi:hypothetical protein
LESCSLDAVFLFKPAKTSSGLCCYKVSAAGGFSISKLIGLSIAALEEKPCHTHSMGELNEHGPGGLL